MYCDTEGFIQCYGSIEVRCLNLTVGGCYMTLLGDVTTVLNFRG